jgi:hypothetical protein
VYKDDDIGKRDRDGYEDFGGRWQRINPLQNDSWCFRIIPLDNVDIQGGGGDTHRKV